MATNFEKYYNETFSPLEKRIKRQTEKLFDIFSRVVTTTNKSNVFWSTIEIKITNQYRVIDRLYSEWNKVEIPELYKREMFFMSKKIKNTKRITSQARINTTSLVNSTGSKQLLAAIVSDSINSMGSSLFQGQKLFKRFARLTQQKLVSESFFESSIIRGIQGGNIRAAVSQQYIVLKNLLGDKKFVQAGNRHYRPETYAELVTRTKFHETQTQGAIITALNHSTDLVRVSSHNTISIICIPFEGRIFSISGKSKDFPQLTDTPPFHPNCLHLTFPEFVEGYSENTLKELSEFSKGTIIRPPFPKGFIPVGERGIA